MTEHTFAYTGGELQRPLANLLERQKAKIAELDAKIAALPGAMVEDAHRAVDLRNLQKADANPARALLNERTTLLVGKRETELWLFESRRAEMAVWRLTMSDLSLLYGDVDVLGLSA